MHVRVHGKAVRSIGPKGGSEQETDYQSQSHHQGTNAGCETKPKSQVGPALCRDLLAHVPMVAERGGNFKSNVTSGSAARLRGGDSWRGYAAGPTGRLDLPAPNLYRFACSISKCPSGQCSLVQ